MIGSAEVCRRLGIDKSTVSRWVNQNPPRIPATRVGNAWVFDEADVEAIRQQLDKRAVAG